MLLASLLKHMAGLQAERWGSELLTEDVEHVDLTSRPFTVRTSDTEVLPSLLSHVQLTYAHSFKRHATPLMKTFTLPVR